jgi:mRNA-degrading endonuclease RelE of RelBE toxin-antitoxin system
MTSTNVVFGQVFLRNLKRLAKKYFNIRKDIDPLIARLQAGETPGDQIPGVGYPVYKARLANSDMQRGTRGGYRIIYYVHLPHLVLLVTIYTKSQQENILPEVLKQIIETELDSGNWIE